MDQKHAIQFCHRYAQKKFYQPVVFVPGIIEIRGKWHNATKTLADIILKDCAGKSVLDLGCMHGFFLHEAIKRGATKAVGIDHDTVEMSIAEEINQIFDDGAELIHANFETYIPDQSFDIVLMMNIIHVLDDPLNTIHRYLALAKDLLIVEYHKDHDQHFCQRPDQTFDSPRSAGHRKVAIFNSA